MSQQTKLIKLYSSHSNRKKHNGGNDTQTNENNGASYTEANGHLTVEDTLEPTKTTEEATYTQTNENITVEAIH